MLFFVVVVFGWERLEHALVEGKRSLIIKMANIVGGLLCVYRVQQLGMNELI